MKILEHLLDVQSTEVLEVELLPPHWQHWHCRLGKWECEMREATRDEQDVDSIHPFCAACMIPMMIRANRLTKEECYGCPRFPSCRMTLPVTCANYSDCSSSEGDGRRARQEQEPHGVHRPRGQDDPGDHDGQERGEERARDDALSSKAGGHLQDFVRQIVDRSGSTADSGLFGTSEDESGGADKRIFNEMPNSPRRRLQLWSYFALARTTRSKK